MMQKSTTTTEARAREVARLMALGARRRDIAERMGVSNPECLIRRASNLHLEEYGKDRDEALKRIEVNRRKVLDTGLEVLKAKVQEEIQRIETGESVGDIKQVVDIVKIVDRKEQEKAPIPTFQQVNISLNALEDEEKALKEQLKGFVNATVNV